MPLQSGFMAIAVRVRRYGDFLPPWKGHEYAEVVFARASVAVVGGS